MKNKRKFILIIIIFFSFFVALFYSIRKERFDGDEMYSYSLSNSPISGYMIRNVSINTFQTDQVFNKALTLQKENILNLRAIYSNQKQDVHPPFYYLLFHISSIFSINNWTKWTGLVLNLIIFIFSLIILYSISKMIIKDEKYSLLTVFLYGTSIGAISTVIFVRMYMLLTLFSLLFVYSILKYHKKQDKKNLMLITISVFFGFMTHYYFLVFAFFITAFYLLYFLIKKNFNQVFIFGVCVLSGVVLGVILFPSSIIHMFKKPLGSETTNNLIKSSIFDNIKKIFSNLNSEAFYNIFFVFALVMILLVGLIIRKKIIEKEKLKVEEKFIILFSVSVIICFMIIVKMLVIFSTRYIYNIYPFVVVIMLFIIYSFAKNFKINKTIENIVLISFVALSFFSLCTIKPSWYSTYTNEEKEIINNVQDYPAIYFFTNDYLLISKSSYLKSFKTTYVASKLNEELIDNIANYLKENNHNKVFVDFSKSNDNEKYTKMLQDKLEYTKSKNMSFGVILEK